jgi:cytochrome c oxidase subunit II
MSSEPRGAQRAVLVAIFALFTAAFVLLGLLLPHHVMPALLSSEGHTAWLTIVLFTVLAAPVAAFVYTAGLYSLLRWRHRGPVDEPPPDAPALRGNGPATILWVSVSSLLVVVLLAWGLSEYNAEQVGHPDTLRVEVVGQQWLWTFRYPGTGVESRTLELPLGRPVRFDVVSKDVTHGFWIPSMGIQIDANQGVVTSVETTTDRLGDFDVRCSQLCGLYHSLMYAPGKVVSKGDFARWLEDQGSSSAAAATVAEVRR